MKNYILRLSQSQNVLTSKLRRESPSHYEVGMFPPEMIQNTTTSLEMSFLIEHQLRELTWNYSPLE